MNQIETLLTKAYHNLRCAEDIYKMEEGDEAFLNYCGYHLQQAVELSIKYTLEINGITPPFVHEIEQLIYLAKENNVDLFLTDYISDHAEMFSSWEAKTRYVLNFKLEKEKIKVAMKEVNNYLDKLIQEYEKKYYNNLQNNENDGFKKDSIEKIENIDEIQTSLSSDIDTENLENNINILLNNIENDLYDINWKLSKNTLRKEIEGIFNFHINQFIVENEERQDKYLKIIPDTEKQENLDNIQILYDFLCDKITNKLGTIEEIANKNKQAAEGEEM